MPRSPKRKRNYAPDAPLNPSTPPPNTLNTTPSPPLAVLDPALQTAYGSLISGSHILHHQGILDAYGHISMRHPSSPDIFVMSHSMAPALVAGLADLVTYHVSDAEPVVPQAGGTGMGGRYRHFAERHIHSEVYKRWPGVGAVCHSHAEAVVPYTVSGVGLRPVYHMAGFLGLGLGTEEKGKGKESEGDEKDKEKEGQENDMRPMTSGVPVFDHAKHCTPSDKRDLLVRTQALGAALAEHFASGNVVTLMRGHGFTAVGSSVEEVVVRAVYTAKNAAMQTSALMIRLGAGMLSAEEGGGGSGGTEDGGGGGGLHYLSAEEAEATDEMLRETGQRPWALWVREVRGVGLYRNELDINGGEVARGRVAEGGGQEGGGSWG